MNEVFVIGKVIEKIDFNFIYKRQYIVKSKTKIELANKSIINIIGYDSIADFMYRNIKVNDTIVVQGKLYSDKIKVERVDKIIKNAIIINIRFLY